MSTQEQIDTWWEITSFLGNLWAQAMAADEQAGEELPRELSKDIVKVGTAFINLGETLKKYRTR